MRGEAITHSVCPSHVDRLILRVGIGGRHRHASPFSETTGWTLAWQPHVLSSAGGKAGASRCGQMFCAAIKCNGLAPEARVLF